MGRLQAGREPGQPERREREAERSEPGQSRYQLPRGETFSTRMTTASATIATMFMTPTAMSTSMRAQQQPRQ